MSYSKPIFWLKMASAMTIGFGLLIAAGAMPALAAPALFLADFMFFPIDGLQEASQAQRLVSAICGGVMVGWGVLLWLIATRLLARDPLLARQLILASLFTWFAVDSLGSLAAGAPMNVLGNIVFLLAFVLPVLWIKSK